jgi:pimeloyl-ACP methyl ester carboxylesterase
VAAPALLVWCRDDRVAGFRFGERLQTRLPGARLEALPDCNHMPMVEQAAKFRAVLRAYLEAPDAVVRTPGKAVAP